MRAGKQSSGLFYRSAPATEDEVRGDRCKEKDDSSSDGIYAGRYDQS